MAVTFEQFFSAISEQESGGNYKAKGVWVNGDRAYGKYQVMGNNIPSWTKQYLGYSMTPEQFLASPSAQEKVARGKLKGYFDKYGAKGAAAMWYSGQPDPTKTYGNPPVYQYANSVYAKASKYPPGGSKDKGSSGGGGGDLVANATKPRTDKEIAASYGFTEDFLKAYPELDRLFKKAVDKGWDAAKFTAEFQDTKWFKTHPASAQKFLVLQYGDPATAKQKISQSITKVYQMANALGIIMTPDMEKKVKVWATKAIMEDWSEGDLRNEIGKYITFGKDGDTLQGEAGELVDKLHTYAYQMGVTPDKNFFLSAAQKVTRGVATQQDYEDTMRKMAKTMYSQWGKQIDAGQTVADLASPYFSSMAQILELPGGSINLFDPTIKKALQGKDPKTGLTSITPIWEFENNLRNDARWKGTQNAQNATMQVAHQVLADFGLKT